MYCNLIGCLLDVGDGGGGGGRGDSVGNILRFECCRIKSAPMQWGNVPFWPPAPDGLRQRAREAVSESTLNLTLLV